MITFIIALVALIILLIILNFIARRCEKINTWVGNFYYAHRGLHNENIPENSMSAFKNALNKGYAIETDIHVTKDDKVVIFHDFNLKRMCGKEIKIEETSYEELKKYTLKNTNEKIPLLSELLETVQGKVPLLIELKNEGTAGKLEILSWDILKNYNGKFAVQSFSPFSIGWYRKHAPHIPRGQLSFPYKQAKEYLNPISAFILSNLYSNFYALPNFISYEYSGLDTPVVKNMIKSGIPVLAWTVKTKNQKQECINKCTNIIFENEQTLK